MWRLFAILIFTFMLGAIAGGMIATPRVVDPSIWWVLTIITVINIGHIAMFVSKHGLKL